jgi:hypothetical protein
MARDMRGRARNKPRRAADAAMHRADVLEGVAPAVEIETAPTEAPAADATPTESEEGS